MVVVVVVVVVVVTMTDDTLYGNDVPGSEWCVCRFSPCGGRREGAWWPCLARYGHTIASLRCWVKPCTTTTSHITSSPSKGPDLL
jgi:hypothetical protein